MAINVFSYVSTNVSTTAYTTLIVATPIAISNLLVSDTSGGLLKIAMGNPGFEVDLFSVPISTSILIPVLIPVGTRLSIKAINNSISSGFNVLSFLG